MSPRRNLRSAGAGKGSLGPDLLLSTLQFCALAAHMVQATAYGCGVDGCRVPVATPPCRPRGQSPGARLHQVPRLQGLGLLLKPLTLGLCGGSTVKVAQPPRWAALPVWMGQRSPRSEKGGPVTAAREGFGGALHPALRGGPWTRGVTGGRTPAWRTGGPGSVPSTEENHDLLF